MLKEDVVPNGFHMEFVSLGGSSVIMLGCEVDTATSVVDRIQQETTARLLTR
jgi:hypothetical protein